MDPPLARMVWDALVNEPVQYAQMPIYSSHGVTAPITMTAGVITSSTGNLAAVTSNNILYYVNCLLPRSSRDLTWRSDLLDSKDPTAAMGRQRYLWA